ncbi:MAG: hypothetical protein ACI3Y9_06325 [Candidatus Cryptobacteroides sp.]
MVQKIDRRALQELFLEAVSGTDFRFVDGSNPFHILLNGKEYWIYIKNLTSAHFENPDVWRAQLPQRDDFDTIKESDIDFILLGYDGENDVYATWNPVWVKQRLNGTGNVSFYSRLSLQQQVRQEKQFKRMQLSNEGEVVVFPRELIRMFFINVQSFFLAEGDYVAMGSKRRPEANEAFKIFTDIANISRFARHMSEEGKSQVTISNYCRTVKSFISDGTITRNRKLFYTYDSLKEYKQAIDQFVLIDEIKEKNEKWHNLVSAAFSAYLDFLILSVKDDNQDDAELLFPKGDNQDAELNNKTPIVRTESSADSLFYHFCSESTLQLFEEYLGTKNYQSNTVRHYLRAIRFLIDAGMLKNHRELFDNCKTYTAYADAASKFFEIPDIKTLNELKHHDYSAAIKQYIEFLCKKEKTVEENGEAESESLSDGDIVHYGSPEAKPLEIQETESVLHDWEAEYTDDNGKLTRIANPELIDKLQPYLNTEYKKTAAALNTIESYYGNRYPQMEFSDWGKLLNDIDWSDPYVHDESVSTLTEGYDSPKRSKRYTLRVEFPDGRVIQENVVSDTYIRVIKEIDPELVELVGLSHAGVGVVSKTLDSKYAKYQKPIGGGWYVMTNSSTSTKSIDLQTISDELELDWKVSLVPLDGSECTSYSRIEVPEGTRSKIRVTFPDGHIIFPNKVLEALVEVVKYAGAERVRELNIINCADNLILKNPAPRYQKPCKPVGNGWLCNTCSDTATKFAQINEISTRLSLGLKVEIV